MTRTLKIPIQTDLTFAEVPDLPTAAGKERFDVYMGQFKIGSLYKDPFGSYLYTYIGWHGHPKFFSTWEGLAKEFGIEHSEARTV